MVIDLYLPHRAAAGAIKRQDHAYVSAALMRSVRRRLPHVPDVFPIVGGVIFLVLGLLHAIYTFSDIRHPRRLVPDNPAVAAAMSGSKVRLSRGGTDMWRAWVGFNFSHSLGAVVFGALVACTGDCLRQWAPPSWLLLMFVAIGALYLVLGVRYWFRIPAVGIAMATACFLAAWVTYAF